jgi:hypothetical protein
MRSLNVPGLEDHFATVKGSLELLLNADDFFLDCLEAIRSGTHFNGRGYSGRTKFMDSLMAPSNGAKNVVPISCDICAIGM